MVLQPRWATLGPITFGEVDALGTSIFLSGLSGWTGSTSSSGQSQQRAGSDGSWLSPAYVPGRVMEAQLTLVGSSFEQVSRSLDELAAAIPVRELDDLVVHDHTRVLTAKVRQTGEFKSAQNGHTAKASVLLESPDYRKYEVTEQVFSTGLPASSGGLVAPFTLPFTIDAVTTSGVLTITNGGKAPSPPLLRVDGPCPPFTLRHNSGRALSYASSVAAGRFLLLDASKRTAKEDGLAVRPVSGSWFDYDPGVNTVTFTATSYDAGALLTSTHQNAWK